MKYDLSRYEPAPMPSDERIANAAEILAKMSEIDPLWGQIATFRRNTLECTGTFPADTDYRTLDAIDVPVPEFHPDMVDFDESWRQHLARCRLAIKHGIERHDLDLRLTRESLVAAEAR